MKPLVIQDFQLGIGESPYKGFAQMRNVDIFTQPGCLKIARKLEPSGNSASVVDELIIWFAQDPGDGSVYGVDKVGTLYQKDSLDVWTIVTGHGTANMEGNGLAVWKGYLFYARQNRIDVMSLATRVWTNDWAAVTPFATPYDLESSIFHPMFAADNGVLIIGNAGFVDTLEQTANTVFDPTDDTTWLYNDKDLELDYYYKVNCIEKLGVDIAIGTIFENAQNNVADTFFWDGSSSFFDSNKTIRFADNGVRQMKNNGNILYTVAGTGITRLFASTTSQAIEVKRFNNITLDSSDTLEPFQAATEVFDGELLLGVGRSITNGGQNQPPLGVYAYRNNSYVLKNIISSGEYGNHFGVVIGAIKVHIPNSYLVSYYDSTNSTPGVDVLSDNFYTGYTASVESAIYQVGTDDDPKTYEKCEIRLGKGMKSTDKVRIQARNDLTDTYVTIAEILGTVYTGKSVIDVKVQNGSKYKDIQVKIDLDTGASETVSPELMSVTLQ